MTEYCFYFLYCTGLFVRTACKRKPLKHWKPASLIVSTILMMRWWVIAFFGRNWLLSLIFHNCKLNCYWSELAQHYLIIWSKYEHSQFGLENQKVWFFKCDERAPWSSVLARIWKLVVFFSLFRNVGLGTNCDCTRYLMAINFYIPPIGRVRRFNPASGLNMCLTRGKHVSG